MQQDKSDRTFSRKKFTTGKWKTTKIPTASILSIIGARLLSFKYNEIARLAKKCDPGYLVVDFGAGVGAYSHFLLRLCPVTIIAIDWSPEALRSIIPSKKGTVLSVCADLHTLPIKQSCIDALFSIDAIGHLRDQEAAIDEINRICRGNAPLFLHSECTDYRKHWPEKIIIKKLGADPIADQDGHFAIRPSKIMRAAFEQRFIISRFFSPAGLLGWCFGYPEKYHNAFKKANMHLLAFITKCTMTFKKVPVGKLLLRTVNMLSNYMELWFGVNGGGSCFACGCIKTKGDEEGWTAIPSVDVVIPTYNRTELLPALVNNILLQCRDNDKIYIVWQGEKEPEIMGHFRVKLIHQKKTNLPKARNAGLKAGGNPIVLFIDDDCSIEEELLNQHRLCYRNIDIGAVAGYVDDPLFPSEDSQPSTFNFSTGELRQNFRVPSSGTTISVMGANMSFLRKALAEIGGFNDRFHGNALWEDIDSAFRIQLAGYSIWYNADARVKHCRCAEGGCRISNTYRDIFHVFANTAYFSCTYAPIDTIISWIDFWKHRLEYLSRKTIRTVNRNGRPIVKHHLHLVLAGIYGVGAGIVRFLIAGKRKKLPNSVIYQQSSTIREMK